MIRVVEHLRAEGVRNLAALRTIQTTIAPRKRSVVRILDILLWASHPASGLGPTMSGWERRLVRVEATAVPSASRTLSSSPSTSPSSLTASPPASWSPSPTNTPMSSPATVRRSFDDVWACIKSKGGLLVVSSRGTEYRVAADVSKGRKVLIARPGSGAIYVHADCFGEDVTCQGTRAGGIYHGSPSVWDC